MVDGERLWRKLSGLGEIPARSTAASVTTSSDRTGSSPSEAQIL